MPDRPMKDRPDRRKNWNNLNEGQRRYAWEQYNLALVRRGLPIDHPIPENQGAGHADGHDIDALLAEGGEPDEAAHREAIEGFDESHLEGGHQSNTHQPAGQVDHGSRMNNVSSTSGGGAPKRPRLGNNENSAAGPSTSADGAKKLPGTAMDQGGAPNEGGPRQMALPHPTVSIHSHVRWFRKVHRFLTWGIAYNNIQTLSATQATFISTPLAFVPWDWLFFYMNDSEFSTLPNGASVNKCKVSILQRNVRIAFPTNSTDSNLATLNQNKNIITSVDLIKKADVYPGRYNAFEANQPMIPTGFDNFNINHLIAMKQDMYGSTTNIDTVVPRHQMGIPQVLPHYAVLVYRPNALPQSDPAGWECLQGYYKEHDADATSGGPILEQEYHPNVGLCKAPHTMVIRKQNAGSVSIPRGSHILDPQTSVISIGASGGVRQVTSTADQVTTTNRNFTYQTSTMQLIEKSQVLYEGLFERNKPRVQPSINIGVQPTPALTTAVFTNDQTNSSFTDTQAYFEVIAECEVNTSYPTFRPLLDYTNVKEGNFWEQAATDVLYDQPLFDGLRMNARTVT